MNETILVGIAAIVVLVLAIAWLAVLRGARQARRETEALKLLTQQMAETQQRLFGQVESLSQANQYAQGEIQKTLAERLDHVTKRLGDSLAESTERTNRTLTERLDTVSKRLGDGLSEQTEKTGKTIGELKTRLEVIDRAQQNITELSGQVVGLQDILANKQARGAFGELQLNDLVAAALPPSAYSMQATLSNGKRADCLIELPKPPGSIVVDAKFPLESYHQLRKAETDAEKTLARRAFGSALQKHIDDIAARYIVPGETAESALLFLPSEAVYAEIHAGFPETLQRSYRARVWIVSPTTLMATLNTVRAVLKDARMREQAGVIQKQVLELLKDVERLDDRVDNLRRHFTQAEKDIRDIETSSQKIKRKGERIEELQLGDESGSAEAAGIAAPPESGPQDSSPDGRLLGNGASAGEA
ncbi:DNA recombination protein RmuC [Oceanibacterium hippocampi]|uniref:DNA recombination protein RmuC homolog n=1 Tax=Oceanibacterium hippocampi TaxID=745714 RepID=A0A1Y5RY15_9PROT|nr:DNA recombination protein RmuC [Oceanibacterium hippocampi]SLN25262.1 DNA recombination protein RmuC [Oceanibacterium hippocampi]